MKYRQLTGVVIKRINFNEADRVITIFTKNIGKMRVLGKGLRRITSKRAPHLEIFTHVNLSIGENHNRLPCVTECQTIENFGNLRKNINRIAIAFHLCEIIERILPDKEKNEDLFKHFVEALHKLNNEKSANILRQEIYRFVNQMLIYLGYLDTGNKLTYTDLIGVIEDIVEKPLNSLKLLKKLIEKDN